MFWFTGSKCFVCLLTCVVMSFSTRFAFALACLEVCMYVTDGVCVCVYVCVCVCVLLCSVCDVYVYMCI